MVGKILIRLICVIGTFYFLFGTVSIAHEAVKMAANDTLLELVVTLSDSGITLAEPCMIKVKLLCDYVDGTA